MTDETPAPTTAPQREIAVPPVPPVEVELDAIRRAMADDRSDYWNGPKDEQGRTLTQRRFQELASPHREKPTPAPDMDDGERASLSTYAANLRKLMRQPDSLYWKDPQYQRDFCELVEMGVAK